MKNFFRRTLALLLVSLLVFPLPAFASEALGSDVLSYSSTLGRGTEYEENIFYGASISDLRREHLVTYTPNTAVTPYVGFGPAVAATAGVSAGASTLEANGYRVLAGINGDFYNVGNAVPLGMVVQNGTLYSGSWDYYAIGFTNRGKIITGKPRLRYELNYSAFNMDTGEVTDLTLPLANYNKDRGDGGAYLYSYDFNRKHTTGTTAAGTDVLLTLTEGQVAIGKSAVFTVSQVLTDNSYAVAMANPDTFVLSVNQSAPIGVQTALATLLPGTELTLTVSSQTSDEWNDAAFALGALYCLLEDGAVSSDIAGQTGSAPRTAIGIKKDGSAVFYTIDGRRAGYSMGATYQMVAKRLLELGCREAYALDGGGSTAMVTTEPGFSPRSLVSRPSDGSERAVSNTLYLISSTRNATGSGGGINVIPASRYLLAGASTTLASGGYDSAYFPVSLSGVTYAASDGTVSGNTFTAPATGGEVTLTARSGSRSGKTTVQVIDKPDTLTVSADGKAVSKLSVSCGKSVKLTASASYNHLALTTDASCFTWSLSDPTLGTLDEKGVFTAGMRSGSATLTVTAGAKSVSLPLTLTGGSRFTDTVGTWAADYIDSLAELGVVGGFDDGSFRPDASLTRAQFSAMLFRALGLREADYADVSLPFADAGDLAAYAVTPVRALYTLGIVGGSEVKGKLCFRGNETLTRAQAAAMIGRAYTLSSDTELTFTDTKDIPAYALPYVSALTEAGIIGGFADGSFCPTRVLTRAQMCKILSLALSRQG